jgi:hypothetical protein
LSSRQGEVDRGHLRSSRNVSRPRPVIALVGSEERLPRALRAAAAARLPAARLEPFSLDRFLSDREAPLSVVLCPSGKSVLEDLEFLKMMRRRALWSSPGVDVWGAIAGLRGSHESAPRAPRLSTPARSGRRTALLLEGDVTLARARRAAASGAPRDWIVERVQRVRLAPRGLEEMRRLGIRWSVLEPVEIVALLASPSLAMARRRWGPLLPRATPVWPATPGF